MPPDGPRATVLLPGIPQVFSADAVVLDLRAVLRVPDAVRVAVDDASALLAGRGGALLVLDPDGQHHLGGNAVEIGGSLLAPPD